MKDLKNKIKATLLTAVLFVGIFGGFYILSKHTKESIAILISFMVVVFIYNVWKLIYDEIRDTE